MQQQQAAIYRSGYTNGQEPFSVLMLLPSAREPCIEHAFCDYRVLNYGKYIGAAISCTIEPVDASNFN